jgi:ribosomal protein S18 acetylase RimI-like enzyme
VTTLRPVRLPDDLEPLWQVAVACDLAVMPESSTTHEEIRGLLEGPTVDPVAGVRVAEGEDGRIDGFISTDLDVEGREVLVDAYARPGSGPEVLDALIAHGVAYARAEVAALEDPSGWVCAGGAFVQDEVYIGALTRAGLRPVRRFHRMHVDLAAAPSGASATLPVGTEIAVVGEDEAAQRVVHEVLEEAFVGHWRHVRRSFEDWISFVRNRGYDPSQWWLATVDGTPAGASVGSEILAEIDCSYVNMLGVLPDYRGRGIARALLLTAFEEARSRGRKAVRLGVDTENGTGAPALYASVGMAPVETIDAYELPLD